MLEAAIIAFREGMEAFLIVAIVIAYLTRTGRGELVGAAYAGVAAAVIASGTLGVYLQSISNNPLTEGAMAMVAGVLVGSLTVHMIKAARTLKKSITDRLENHAQKGGMMAMFGVFAFTLLMVTREGMETALMMNAAMATSSAGSVFIGAMIGLGVAGIVGWVWTQKSHLINLPLFLQTSAVFLVVFSVYLFFYGLHEFMEAGVFAAWIPMEAEEAEEGLEWGGTLASTMLVAIPLGWLGYAMYKDRARNKKVAS